MRKYISSTKVTNTALPKGWVLSPLYIWDYIFTTVLPVTPPTPTVKLADDAKIAGLISDHSKDAYRVESVENLCNKSPDVDS